MSTSENPTQPLLRAPSQQTAINMGPPAQGSTRAYKVAGLTLLACVLIVSQVMIGYFLLSQREDIKSLEEQSKNLKTELTSGRSVSAPMRMHVPMNALPEMMDDSVDMEESTEGPGETVLQQATNCQLEAAGMKDVPVPGFHPTCDERGLYRAQQCFMGHCWCVNPVTGEQIPGTQSPRQARCSKAAHTGGLSNLLTLHDVNV